MNGKIIIALITVLCGMLFFFNTGSKDRNKNIEFVISEYTDEEYSDNPDLGFRAENYQEHFFNKGALKRKEKNLYDLQFFSNKGDTIQLSDINLATWIPLIPEHLREDDYLTSISLVNQEWNRNQVSFSKKDFSTTDLRINRVDIARNCLASYLWEVILYSEENKIEYPFAHGWFNFPEKEYEDLFFSNNNVSFENYRYCLSEWEDPLNKFIDRSLLRRVVKNLSVNYKDLSDEMYPKKGEREKKYKEIIYPTSFNTMRDLQTDSTSFATFSPPGVYNKSDPRKTELGRFLNLDSAFLREINPKNSDNILEEIELIFSDQDNIRATKFIIGGIDFSEIPVLPVEEANKGWQNSMGFGNHTFYESFDKHKEQASKRNPFYAFLTDNNDQWLDSHKVGVDGPLIHFDSQDRRSLHIWLLSFERHALIGHYIIKINERNAKSKT